MCGYANIKIFHHQYPTGIGILTGTGIMPGLDHFAGTAVNRYRDWRQNEVCRDSTGIDFSSPGFNLLHNFRGNYVIIDVARCFMCPDRIGSV